MIDLRFAQRCVDLLNEMIEVDPGAVNELVNARVRCNDRLADHPSVQVGASGEAYEVGLIGVLNGLCGAYDSGPRQGWGAVAVIFGADGRVTGAKLLRNEESA